MINETTQNQSLQVYPTVLENNYRKIILQLDAEELKNITIYDASGRQVQRIDQNTPQGERVEHEIDPLPSGLYHIRVHGLSGQSYLSKIIVR